jgi:hypothetical protein
MAANAEKKPEEKKLIVPETVVAQKHVPAVSPDATAMMQIIDRAARDPNFDVDKLRALLEVKERWDREEARKAFIAAMALFKAEVPQILKSKNVSIPGGAVFKHAELATVCDAVVPALSKFGFAHRWKVGQAERLITVTCLLTHERGHETETTLQGFPDDSGKKNAIQQVGSTVTYLERYTLMAAVGLAAKGMDNDGNGGGDTDGGLTEKQIADFKAAIDTADSEDSLKVEFGKAWNAAEAVKDRKAQQQFKDARDTRRVYLKRRA